MFWVSEQQLADQANGIKKKIWITELEIEGLERRLGVEGNMEINDLDHQQEEVEVSHVAEREKQSVEEVLVAITQVI